MDDRINRCNWTIPVDARQIIGFELLSSHIDNLTEPTFAKILIDASLIDSENQPLAGETAVALHAGNLAPFAPGGQRGGICIIEDNRAANS